MAVTQIDPELSRLYREASTEEPPAALDATVLAAARKRVAKSERRDRSSWSRWMVPASLMATVVLGVSIAFLVEREHPETVDTSTIRQTVRIAPPPASPPPAGVAESAKLQAADGAASGVAARKDAPAAEVQAPFPTPAEPAKSPADALKKRANAIEPRSERDSRVTRDSAMVQPSAGAPAAVPAPSPPPAESVKSQAEAFPAEVRAKAIEPKLERKSKVAEDSTIAGPGAGAAAAPAGAAAGAAAAKPARIREQAVQRSPEAWLEEIRRLKREGRETEAAEQLAEFRKAYPAYRLPEALLN